MKRLWTTLHALLTLACAGCCVFLLLRERHTPSASEPPGLGPDETVHHTLREYLGVQWIGGPIPIPPGQDHYGIALLHYRDGQFVSRFGKTIGTVSDPKDRTTSYVAMWGRNPDNSPRLVGLTGKRNNGFYSRSKIDFSEDEATLLADSRDWHRWFGDPNGQGERFNGYLVKAVVGGKALREGHEGNYSLYDAATAIKWRRDVVVLGLKTFDTKQEAVDWIFSQGTPDNP